MDGIVYLEDINTPDADIVKEMETVGKVDTPFYHLAKKAVPKDTAKPIDGHGWWYELRPKGTGKNKHIEGGTTTNKTNRNIGKSLNHYQIVKHEYGVTGSSKNKKDINGTNEFEALGTTTMEEHMLDIEIICLSDNEPVQRVNNDDESLSVPGEMAGIRHWLVLENTIQGGGAPLSKQLLRDMFKIGWREGVECKYAFMNDSQKDKLDNLDKDSNNGIYGKNDLRDNNYQTIKNFSYAKEPVKVIITPHLPQNMILGVNFDCVALVHERLTEIEKLGKIGDKDIKTIISELTMRVNNPYAVCAIEDLEE